MKEARVAASRRRAAFLRPASLSFVKHGSARSGKTGRDAKPTGTATRSTSGMGRSAPRASSSPKPSRSANTDGNPQKLKYGSYFHSSSQRKAPAATQNRFLNRRLAQ